jgi:predicted deacylase
LIDDEVMIISGHHIYPGERLRFEIPLPSLVTTTEVGMPVEVIRGQHPGPVLLITAAIHGDEVNGVEAIHRLLKSKKLKNIQGTVIAVPIVNIYGFHSNSRYLPDRRDLNRCFPGKPDGTLGARIAHVILEELVKYATHVIDLHTGAIHRSNIPQIRAFVNKQEIRDLAKSFGAHVIINSNLKDGSFREAVRSRGIPMLLFEGGQALRFEEHVIKVTLRGIFEVMKFIGMIKSKKSKPSECLEAKKSFWVRASESGILKIKKTLGSIVKRGELLALVTDTFGKVVEEITAPFDGVIIGGTHLPIIFAGEASFTLGLFEDIEIVEEYFELMDIAPYPSL